MASWEVIPAYSHSDLYPNWPKAKRWFFNLSLIFFFAILPFSSLLPLWDKGAYKPNAIHWAGRYLKDGLAQYAYIYLVMWGHGLLLPTDAIARKLLPCTDPNDFFNKGIRTRDGFKEIGHGMGLMFLCIQIYSIFKRWIETL